jgi:GNAT superfamily N-acetyltransferase
MNIRTARESDIPGLLDLIEELMLPPGSRPPSYTREAGLEGLRAAFESDAAAVLVAEDGEGIVGLATLYETFTAVRYGKRCWLQDLVVTARRRSEGVGKALLDAATSWARGRGCTHLMLDSGIARTDAHRFYRREGMDQHSITFERRLD